MKRFTSFAAAALLVAGLASAEGTVGSRLGNPVNADGDVIVLWDVEKGQFAEDNNFEIDETVVIAVDVTGNSELEAWLSSTQRGVDNLGIAFAMYTTNIVPEGEATPASLDGRFKRIQDNVYGCTINFYHFLVSRMPMDGWMGYIEDGVYTSTTEGQVTEFNADIFGFGWTDENPGAMWWQYPQQGWLNFKTLPYTGTKTGEIFYKEDLEEGDPDFFPGDFTDWAGYGSPAPEAFAIAGIDDVAADVETIAVEYYNIQGQKLNAAPENGLYIQKAIKADGTIKASKLVK